MADGWEKFHYALYSSSIAHPELFSFKARVGQYIPSPFVNDLR